MVSPHYFARAQNLPGDVPLHVEDKTINGSWSAQWEHTVLVTEAGCEVLTSESLQAGVWTRLRLVPAAPGIRTELISESVSAGARFYRVNPL